MRNFYPSVRKTSLKPVSAWKAKWERKRAIRADSSVNTSDKCPFIVNKQALKAPVWATLCQQVELPRVMAHQIKPLNYPNCVGTVWFQKTLAC